MRRAALALLLAALPALPVRASEPVATSDGRYVMGTILEITLWTDTRVDAARELDELFALASRLDVMLTRFDPESALSRFNRAAGSGAQSVPPELAALLQRSAELSRLCRASFDVTVGPLVELWQQAGRRGVIPTASELRAARKRVGSEHLRVTQDKAELRLPGMSVDLGGIAKGWAIDRMAERLRAQPAVHAALLSFGGSSVWALGTPPGKSGWRILLRGAGERMLGVATLRDRALSVSGSLGQWTEIDGRLYGHVIDPRSGQPITRRLQAVVVSSDATLAEALTKALLLLGEREGLALLKSIGVEGSLSEDGGGSWSTPGFASWVVPVSGAPEMHDASP